MKTIDISQEVFSCAVYPGDSVPEKRRAVSMDNGAVYNLTEFSMCAHNGTHVDAPFHFINDGKTVDGLDLSRVVGACTVVAVNGVLTGERAEALIDTARRENADAARRILLKGDAVVTEEAAAVFVKENVLCVGVESQSVGPVNAPMAVHKILLGAEIVLLEGLRLQNAEVGVYTLCAAPLNLGGCDGAPCRAILIKE